MNPKLDKLLEETDGLKVEIIFATPNKTEHFAFKITSHLMALYSQNDKENIKHTLDDWYLADKKDYDLFAAKYSMNGELTQQEDKIEAMNKYGGLKTLSYFFHSHGNLSQNNCIAQSTLIRSVNNASLKPA